MKIPADQEGNSTSQDERVTVVGVWWRHLRDWPVALGMLVLVSACSPAASPATTAAASPAASPLGQACAWPTEVNAQTANTAFPDTAAGYWLEPFEVSAGLRIVVAGVYPNARYASVSVYSAAEVPFTSNGVGSSLPDFRIAPDSGSVNPWQQGAAPGGHFTVTLREDVAANQVNTLPLAPAGTTRGKGYLVYRVYLPAGGDFSTVPLPTLTLEQGGTAQQLSPCATRSSPVQTVASVVPSTTGAVAEPGATTAPSGAEPALRQFFKPALNTLMANADTAYLATYLVPPAQTGVVVITAKAPTFAPGDQPSPWPASGEDLRYWSMCVGLGTGGAPTVVNALPGGSTDWGCRADHQTNVDAAGKFAYVVGTEAERDAIERVPGVTFLPFSAAQPQAVHVLLFREMVVSSGFHHSTQDVTQTGDPAAAAAVMGRYYPRAALCPLSTLIASGVLGCTQ